MTVAAGFILSIFGMLIIVALINLLAENISRKKMRKEMEDIKNRKYCKACGGKIVIKLTPYYYDSDTGMLLENIVSFYCEKCDRSIWDYGVSTKLVGTKEDVLGNWPEIVEDYISWKS